MVDKLEFTEQTVDSHVHNEQMGRSGAIGLARDKAIASGADVDPNIFKLIEETQKANLQELSANLKNAAKSNSLEMAEKAYEKFETDVRAQVETKSGANSDTPDGQARLAQVEKAFSLVDSESTITGKITSGIGEVASNVGGVVKEQLVDAKGDGKTSGIIGLLVGGVIGLFAFGGGFEGGILDSLWSMLVIAAAAVAGAFAGNWINEAADSREANNLKKQGRQVLGDAKEYVEEKGTQVVRYVEDAGNQISDKVQPLTEEAAKKLAAQRDNILSQMDVSDGAVASNVPHAVKTGAGKHSGAATHR